MADLVRAIAAAGSCGLAAERAKARAAFAALLLTRGRTAEARATAERALEEARAAADPRAETAALTSLAWSASTALDFRPAGISRKKESRSPAGAGTDDVCWPSRACSAF